ncbi:hypothetical protein N2152v2_001926 [Parachlorella kessleri]
MALSLAAGTVFKGTSCVHNDRELPAIEVLEGGRLKRTEFNYSFGESDDNAAVCQVERNGSKRKLKVRGTPDGYYADGLTKKMVISAEEALDLFRQGAQHRKTARTAMNASSSRSHAIFSLELSMEKFKPAEGTTTRCTAQLNLVDLAGSERQAKSRSEGQTLEEAKFINKSLSHLSLVINKLMERGQQEGAATHIPYADSNLTKLLKERLGGTARTMMIVCLSPERSNISETINSIDFGRRVRHVQNMPTIVEARVVRVPAGSGRSPMGPTQGALLPSFGSTFCSPTNSSNYHTPASKRTSAASDSAAHELAAALQREAAAQEELARLAGQLDAAEQAGAKLAEELEASIVQQGQLVADMVLLPSTMEQLASRERECRELAAALDAKEAEAVELQGRLRQELQEAWSSLEAAVLAAKVLAAKMAASISSMSTAQKDCNMASPSKAHN